MTPHTTLTGGHDAPKQGNRPYSSTPVFDFIMIDTMQETGVATVQCAE